MPQRPRVRKPRTRFRPRGVSAPNPPRPSPTTCRPPLRSSDAERRFEARTFHHRDFDPVALVQRKQALGLSISVVLPARNEADHVGRVVEVLKRETVELLGLVDELLVVDGDSEDDTGHIARTAGAKVVRQSDVLPEAGTAAGKGEALWKGLHASTGDIVLFIDADILDIDGRFVIGLAGPLLTEDDVAFVKATYDRPIRMGGELQPSGGGRVTELLARPLLTTYWPELSFLAQPLSGEYGGRRTLLESLPFVRGYGVELAMLIDIAARLGPDAIAQVDLGRRVHDNQPLANLGRMATEILQVALDRAARHGRASFTDPFGDLLLQPVRDLAGRLELEPHRIAPSERPPLRDYLAGRG